MDGSRGGPGVPAGVAPHLLTSDVCVRSHAVAQQLHVLLAALHGCAQRPGGQHTWGICGTGGEWGAVLTPVGAEHTVPLPPPSVLPAGLGRMWFLQHAVPGGSAVPGWAFRRGTQLSAEHGAVLGSSSPCAPQRPPGSSPRSSQPTTSLGCLPWGTGTRTGPRGKGHRWDEQREGCGAGADPTLPRDKVLNFLWETAGREHRGSQTPPAPPSHSHSPRAPPRTPPGAGVGLGPRYGATLWGGGDAALRPWQKEALNSQKRLHGRRNEERNAENVTHQQNRPRTVRCCMQWGRAERGGGDPPQQSCRGAQEGPGALRAEQPPLLSPMGWRGTAPPWGSGAQSCYKTTTVPALGPQPDHESGPGAAVATRMGTDAPSPPRCHWDSPAAPAPHPQH